jgi:pyruvate/oxaloacetate carboxyltransferase
LNEVLKEVPIVRKELGYPPLVTPTSQLVGIQAVLNVISGQRYSIVPKEIKDYVKGLYGKPPAPIDEKIKKKIIGDEKPITCRPADLLAPALGKIPEEVKPYIESEEDEITYVLFPQTAVEFFKKREMKHEEAKPGIPLQTLAELEEVAAISVAAVSYLRSLSVAKALTLPKTKKSVSYWVLAARRNHSEYGA